jgi:Tfp pilus assembly PilM family ATPase
MAQLSIGLDLGFETIRCVRLQSSFRSVAVLDMQRVYVPQDERPYPERVREALRALPELCDPGVQLATALPGDEVSLHLLDLPFVDRKKIDQTIGFELENHIPFALDEVVYDYFQVAKTPQGVCMMVGLCASEHLGAWLQIYKDVGLDPRQIGAESLAYTSLIDLLPSCPEGEAAAFVDVGKRLTSVCVYGASGVSFARTLSAGLGDIFGTRAKHNETEPTFVLTEQQPSSEELRGKLAHLLRELRQTFATYSATHRQPVTTIWLCGAEALACNLDEFLAEELQMPTQCLSTQQLPLPGIERLDHDRRLGEWIKALGLALHAHQGGRRGWLNLRRGVFSFTADSKYWRGKIVRIAAGLLILMILAIGSGVVRYLSLSSSERALDLRLREVTQALLGKSYDNPEIALSIIKEKTSPGADPLPRITALDVLRELHSRLPNDIKVRLKDIDILPKKIEIKGYTDTFESVDTIKKAFEGYQCFREIQKGRTRKTPDESEIEFEMTIVFEC